MQSTQWNPLNELYLLSKFVSSFSMTGNIYFQTSHFADFEQFKLIIIFLTFIISYFGQFSYFNDSGQDIRPQKQPKPTETIQTLSDKKFMNYP